ncbi:hypothetical protein Rhopal_004597-T1 [Rhodotorula paludigena]|uniref:F-box domain-containing protein n=1 Tax=Rhodotorula paludigena TaxID=86838 RepID=A0AAV5GNS0_9BASI|nr:hypothetical protein Rhopal_004597-T1 [Rhodotorula paludigena]
MDSDSGCASLASLPPELVLRILALLDPQSLVRTGTTCSALLALAREDSLWRAIVLELVDEHGAPAKNAADDHLHPPHPSAPSTWLDQAKFLLPHSHHLGYFASSLPYNSRVYTIHAAQVVPRNHFDLPNWPISPSVVPFGSSRDAFSASSVVVSARLNPHHPYAGLSISLIDPYYDMSTAAMFDITPSDGPCLSRPNSHTREGLAAAAMRAPHASSSSGSAVPRLRLALDSVTQRVARPPASSHPDPSLAAGRAARDPAREELNREALFALFSGRLPRRGWPTLQLVGLEEVNTRDVPHLRAGRTDPPRNVLRLAPGEAGAFRGLREWLAQRAGERPLAEVVQPENNAAGQDDEAYVTGFKLRARRRPRASPLPPAADATSRGETSASAGTGERWSAGQPRRRGVGTNGGPAVLWHGREEDPDERPAVTILRAGDEAEGGFVLRLPGSPPQRPGTALPIGAEDVPELDEQQDEANEDDTLADAVDAAGEVFFPVKAPAKPLDAADYHAAPATNSHGEFLAPSIEGLWLGTFGSHGLEFVWVSTGFIECEAGEDDLSEESSDSEEEGGRRTVYRRAVTATKVTGDPNVPSGQTSWVALLPSLTSPVLPTIPLRTFQHLSSLDPFNPAYEALNNGAGPDWQRGTARAFGRIALTGFANPSWTHAEVRFLSTEVEVARPGDEVETRESVEEIHLRWDELQKVGVFKRVRI